MEKVKGFLLKSQKELLYSLNFPIQRQEFLQPIRSITLKEGANTLFQLIVPQNWSPIWEKLGLEILEGDMSLSTAEFLSKKTPTLVYRCEDVESYPSLYHLVQLKPWSEEPEYRYLLLWIRDQSALARIIHESLILGRDHLWLAFIQNKEQEGCLLWAENPSYFSLQEWVEKNQSIEIFYPLQEKSDVYLPWGYSHPLKNLFLHAERLQEFPADPQKRSLWFYRKNHWWSVSLTQLTDIYHYISFRLPEIKTDSFQKIETLEKFQVPLKIMSKDYPSDPLLWRLPWEEKDRLEQLFSSVSEEDLTNILICQFSDQEGKRYLFIRELVLGKSRKFLDFGPFSYSTFRNIKNLYVPSHRTLEPEIRLTRYTELFHLKSGFLTILDEVSENQYRIFHLEELAFQSLPVFIDYLVSEHRDDLKELLNQTFFDFQQIPIEFIGFTEASSLEEKRRLKLEKDSEAFPMEIKNKTELLKVSEKATLSQESAVAAFASKSNKPKNVAQEELLRIEDVAENQCISDPFSLKSWQNLGEAKFRFNNPAKSREATLCLENALWLARDTATEEQQKNLFYPFLESVLFLAPGWEQQLSKTLETLKHPVERGLFLWLVLRWLKSIPSTPTHFLQVVELLKSQNNVLRKKTSWLLWREILQMNQDRSEEERQRERLLGALNREGLQEKDTFPFVRQKLAKRFSQRRTGAGITNVLQLIDTIFKTQRTKKKDSSLYETAGKAFLARGYTDIGRTEEATGYALEIFKLKVPQEPNSLFNYYRSRIVAAGALLRLGHFSAESEVTRLLEQMQQETRKLQNNDDLSSPPKKKIDSYHLKKLFVEMLKMVHYGGALSYSEFTHRIFQLIQNTIFDNNYYYKATILQESMKFLSELGINEEICQFAKSLLQQEETLRDCYTFELVFSALYSLLKEEIFDENFSQLLLKVNYQELSIICVQHLDKAIVFYGSEFGERLLQQISKTNYDKKHYIFLMIQTCLLEQFSQEGKTEKGFELLSQIFQEVFSKKLDLPDIQAQNLNRQTLLMRLVEKIPCFGNISLGVTHIKSIISSLSYFEDVGHQGEVLIRIAQSLSQLGNSEETFQILNQVLQLSKEIIERRSQHYPICFKVIEICIQSLNKLEEEADRCLAVVESAYQILQTARKKIKTLNRYYLCLAEFRCGFQFVQLGQGERGLEIIEGLLKKIEEFEANNIDSIEFMQEVTNITPLLDEQASSKLLEIIFHRLHTMGQDKEEILFIEYSTRLIETCIEELVQGEPLFKNELAKYQGLEERIIRQRLVTESITISS